MDIKPTVETLRKNVFEMLETCRRHLKRDGAVNMSPVEGTVRAYCEAVATLPKEEGRLHAGDLHKMMDELGVLGQELTAAREDIRAKLDGLDRVKQANVAYQRSDSIGTKRIKPAVEDND